MLIDEHFKYLNWLHDKGITPELDYISNGTVPLAKVQKVLDKFDKITMSLSIDAVGSLSNYMRTGSQWENLRQNIRDYSAYFKEHNHHLDISATVSVFNVTKLGKLARMCDLLDIQFNLNFLRHPSWMSVLGLSDNCKEYVIDEISKLDGYISTKKMKTLYNIVKFLNTNETVDLDNTPIWRHIIQREMRYNTVNTNDISFARVDPEWWDMLVLEP